MKNNIGIEKITIGTPDAEQCFVDFGLKDQSVTLITDEFHNVYDYYFRRKNRFFFRHTKTLEKIAFTVNDIDRDTMMKTFIRKKSYHLNIEMKGNISKEELQKIKIKTKL